METQFAGRRCGGEWSDTPVTGVLVHYFLFASGSPLPTNLHSAKTLTLMYSVFQATRVGCPQAYVTTYPILVRDLHDRLNGRV